VGYYQGDYYRGDYYRGDPFNPFGILKGALKIGGKIAGAVTGISIPKPIAPPPMGFGPIPTKVAAPKGAPGAVKAPGGKAMIQRFLPGGATGYVYGRSRRMNVANAKALRRAIRRQKGFIKLARRALAGTGMTIGRRGQKKATRRR